MFRLVVVKEEEYDDTCEVYKSCYRPEKKLDLEEHIGRYCYTLFEADEFVII